MTLRRALILALALAPALRAGAQQPAIPGLTKQEEGVIESTREANEAEAVKAAELQEKAFAAIRVGKYTDAEGYLREQLKHDGKNFVIYYNLACVKSLQGDGAASGDLLLKAVENGFIDIYLLRRDPQLGAARKDAAYKNLIDAWPKILGQHLEANLKHAVRIFNKGKYETTRDERLKVAYMSAMDAKSTETAREDIGRLYDWGLQTVFADLATPGSGDGDAWVVVVLPSQRDFLKWTVAMYGASAANNFAAIGGSYIHDQKRLVSQDLGSSLRHEFFHVLHWRSMTRLGQMHPIWIQEGLCSLVEDYDCPGGKAEALKPVPSWRSNIVRRLALAGRLAPLKQLAGYSYERFTGSAPLANYAQARTFFLYLADQGKLKDWYSWYSSHFDDDPSGIKSIEHTLGKPIDQIDKDYRAWVRALPEVAEQIRPGHAGLGVDVDAGNGDGPVIVEIPRDRRSRTPNPAAAAGLKVGDVITAIDGRPTRDLNELVRLLGEHKAGDEVEVSYRRGAEHGSAKVKLSPQ